MISLLCSVQLAFLKLLFNYLLIVCHPACADGRRCSLLPTALQLRSHWLTTCKVLSLDSSLAKQSMNNLVARTYSLWVFFMNVKESFFPLLKTSHFYSPSTVLRGFSCSVTIVLAFFQKSSSNILYPDWPLNLTMNSPMEIKKEIVSPPKKISAAGLGLSVEMELFLFCCCCH